MSSASARSRPSWAATTRWTATSAGQKIIEKKLDGVVEQTAELLEFRTTVKTKLDELKEVEEVTKVNCYDIAKLKAVK